MLMKTIEKQGSATKVIMAPTVTKTSRIQGLFYDGL